MTWSAAAALLQHPPTAAETDALAEGLGRADTSVVAYERIHNRPAVHGQPGECLMEERGERERGHREELVPQMFRFAPYFSVRILLISRSRVRRSSRIPATISPTNPNPNSTTPEITSTMIKSRSGRNPTCGGPKRRYSATMPTTNPIENNI